jgi:sirohydrochlorin cobaltochelatase
MKPGLVIVGHGSKNDDGVAEFSDFVALVAKLAQVDVTGGFLELSSPPMTDAVAELYERGHRRLVAVPLVLVGAGHAKGDVPAALVRERMRRDGLTFGYGRPLGPHPSLLELLDQRIAEVVTSDERPDTAVVLVGRGATDPDANADVAKTARLLQEGRGFLTVETSFVSLAEPGVPAALERSRRLGARRVVVSPYFLFSGVLPDRVVSQARQWAEQHPEIDVRCAAVLGPDERIARLVLERYGEVLTGDVRMSCDTCIYRIALPGYEAKVGAPQVPHDHPDDPAHHHHHH